MTTRRLNTTEANPWQQKPSEIHIMDSTTTFSMENQNPSLNSTASNPVICRKLRRRKGDKRARMALTHRAFVLTGTTAASLLLLLFLQLLDNNAATAYLNGANPNNSNLPKTRKPNTKTSPSNERYTFLTKPRDRYFTAKGVLPPLLPSSERQGRNLLSPLPPIQQDETIGVTYTNDPNVVDEWLCKNVPYDGCFLGFDIERLPESRSERAEDKFAFAHAAVVQLATDKACLVVHLVDSSCSTSSSSVHPRHSNACARILRSVLEDPSIIKAGCSIDEDLVLLHELWDKQHHHHSIKNAANLKRPHKKKAKTKNPNKNPRKVVFKNIGHHHNSHAHHVPTLQARSRFDLGCVVFPKTKAQGIELATEDNSRSSNSKNHHHLWLSNSDQNHYKIVAKRTDTIPNKSGLQGLCKFVLGFDLPKEKDTCASDWTRFPLTDDQITYAARDAWAGAAIATKLASMDVACENNNGDSNGKNTDSNHGSSSSPDEESSSSSVFSRANLIKVLRRSETPLPQLAQRHRQRKEAKSELHTILHPYARNIFLNQQNRRRQDERQKQLQQQLQRNSTVAAAIVNGTATTSIDVATLFADYPLSSRRTLANYAQRQQQLMEKSLPKRILKRTIVLRQTVNAKVIDHKVVFEVDLVYPGSNKKKKQQQHALANHKSSSTKNKGKPSKPKQQRHYSGRKRRNQHHGGRDSNSSSNRRS